MSPDRLAHESRDGRRQIEGERGGLRGGAHLAPRLAEDIDELLARIVGVLRREGADLVFEEDEARGVLERLRAGVFLQIGLRDPRRDLGGLGGWDAGIEREGAGALGLLGVERAAPGEVAGLALGKRRAGREPALEVLRARGEAQRGRGVGHEAHDPGLDALTIDQLGRATIGGTRRIGGVGGIDELAGAVVGGHARRKSSAGAAWRQEIRLFALARIGNVGTVHSDSAASRDEELAAFLVASAPRRVPERFAKKAKAQFAGMIMVVLGGFIGLLGLVIEFSKQPWRALDDWTLARESAVTAPGRIVAAEATNLKVHGVQIWSYDFTFSVNGVETTATCFAARGRWQIGNDVTVRYLPDDPAMAVAEGGRRSRGGGGMAWIGLFFPAAGLSLLAWALSRRRLALHLLTHGRLDEAVVESIAPTGTKINGHRVHAIKLRATGGEAGAPLTVRFHAPEVVALAESRLASGQPVFLLRDPGQPNRVIFPEAL